jgi:hypothetical protein
VAARIALIHAVRVAMDPIAAAFVRGWPEAETVNLLDEALSRDLERRGTSRTDDRAHRALAATRRASADRDPLYLRSARRSTRRAANPFS